MIIKFVRIVFVNDEDFALVQKLKAESISKEDLLEKFSRYNIPRPLFLAFQGVKNHGNLLLVANKTAFHEDLEQMANWLIAISGYDTIIEEVVTNEVMKLYSVNTKFASDKDIKDYYTEISSKRTLKKITEDE